MPGGKSDMATATRQQTQTKGDNKTDNTAYIICSRSSYLHKKIKKMKKVSKCHKVVLLGCPMDSEPKAGLVAKYAN